MVAIMCGGEEAIGEACDTWPELLTARLCHMYPILPLQSSLGILLDKCLQEKGESLDPCMLTLQDLLTVNLPPLQMSAISHHCYHWVQILCFKKLLDWYSLPSCPLNLPLCLY